MLASIDFFSLVRQAFWKVFTCHRITIIAFLSVNDISFRFTSTYYNVNKMGFFKSRESVDISVPTSISCCQHFVQFSLVCCTRIAIFVKLRAESSLYVVTICVKGNTSCEIHIFTSRHRL